MRNLRTLRFNKKILLEEDHFLRKIPGAYDKQAQQIARNVRDIIGNQEAPTNETWESSITKYNLETFPLTLVDYQREILEPPFLTYAGLYLKWAGGAGKTIAATLWATHKWDVETSCLYIITTAGAKRQWADVIKKYTHLSPIIIDEGEWPDWYEAAKCVIINWDLIADLEVQSSKWLRAHKDATIILDEIHYGKAPKRVKREISAVSKQIEFSQLRTRAAVAARLCLNASRRIGLSATPYSIGVIDLWAQLDMLEPGCWGKWVDFAFRYCDARTGEFGGLDTSGASNIDELKQRLSTLLHTVSRQRLEATLPGKTRELIALTKADLNAPMKNAIQLVKEAKASGDEETFWEAQLAVAASMKRDWVINILKDALRSDQKIVVLTNRREQVDVLFDALNTREFKDKVLASHGATSLEEREHQRILYRDNNGPLALIGTHESWGTAIDGLQSTDIAVMLSLPYTPRTLGQSETRFIRKGQSRRVRIIYPIAEGTVDDRVNERLLQRLDTLKDLLDGEEESDAARAVLSGLGDGDAGLQSVLDGLLEELGG